MPEFLAQPYHLLQEEMFTIICEMDGLDGCRSKIWDELM